MATRAKSIMPAILLFVMLIIGALAALALLDLASSLPDLNAHALEKHQTQAQIAHDYVNNLPNAEHCKWSCDDGRDRYVCGMGNGKWAIVVLAGEKLITSFVADQKYAKLIIDTPGCSNPWHYVHP